MKHGASVDRKKAFRQTLYISERKDKTPEQVSDENYKVVPNSAGGEHLNKRYGKAGVTGENYQLREEIIRE